MAEQTKPEEKKMEENKQEKVTEKQIEQKVSEKKAAEIAKSEVKVDNVKPVVTSDSKAAKSVVEKPKKTEAVARLVSAHASKRHCMYIGNFIKGKTVDAAMADLNDVIAMKKIVPFKGEIPHRKGKIMSGRYPINASKIFIAMLKALKGNILVNGLDLEKTRIVSVVSNWASRPRRANGKAKRAHVEVIARQLDAPVKTVKAEAKAEEKK
jgi:ribosomal protein L22